MKFTFLLLFTLLCNYSYAKDTTATSDVKFMSEIAKMVRTKVLFKDMIKENTTKGFKLGDADRKKRKNLLKNLNKSKKNIELVYLNTHRTIEYISHSMKKYKHNQKITDVLKSGITLLTTVQKSLKLRLSYIKFKENQWSTEDLQL